MAIVESTGGADLGASAGSSSRNIDSGAVPETRNMERHQKPAAWQKPHIGAIRMVEHQVPFLRPHRDPVSFQMNRSRQLQQQMPPQLAADHGLGRRPNGRGIGVNGGEGSFNRGIQDLEDLLSKLNPMAEEFVPPSLVNHGSRGYAVSGGVHSNGVGMHDGFANAAAFENVGFFNGGTEGNGAFANGGINGNGGRRKKSGYSQGKRRVNNRTTMAQQEERIRRTVYVSDIDQLVTEEELAALFLRCGPVFDCRVCGDPNSVLRFAFIEFFKEEDARAALDLAGTVLGYYPVRVLPSKTAIAPVDDKFLPKSEDEREMCRRTIYCTNIDKKVTQTDLKMFFEQLCGEVDRLRLLGDYHHSTRIAFVEFARADSAINALNCSGVILGAMPIRISPSKTPVRPRAPRPPMH